MSDRAYTVKELDALRRCMDHKYLYGTYSWRAGGPHFGRQYMETEKAETVEQWVRTAMLAGHTAEDLIASEEPVAPSPQSAVAVSMRPPRG